MHRPSYSSARSPPLIFVVPENKTTSNGPLEGKRWSGGFLISPRPGKGCIYELENHPTRNTTCSGGELRLDFDVQRSGPSRRDMG